MNCSNFAEVIIFGDSNVLKYLKRFTGPKTIPTFTFSELKQNIKHLKQEKFIIVEKHTENTRSKNLIFFVSNKFDTFCTPTTLPITRLL